MEGRDSSETLNGFSYEESEVLFMTPNQYTVSPDKRDGLVYSMMKAMGFHPGFGLI